MVSSMLTACNERERLPGVTMLIAYSVHPYPRHKTDHSLLLPPGITRTPHYSPPQRWPTPLADADTKPHPLNQLTPPM